ncbi:unnamed protein product [Mytilus edulis]|uniref:Endonuclease/exonuclease/phosphatase domain-containing protein n=1 Tax=Mytilus edulis TaxID=6550 RepID=A0A8S3UZJ3_MYTED|nr:unnamed protein product [Mytilus edulis]
MQVVRRKEDAKIHREIIKNYSLNVDKALLKKLEATQRSTSMEYKQTNGGLVIKADAATFELLKHATVAYFEELPCNIGKATIQRETDSSKNATVQITIKMKEKCGKTYTVNLYLTTCTLMVNGKNPENFGDRDIKEIHKLIENVNNGDKNKTITKLNEIMKSKLEQALQGKRVQPKYADKDEKVSIQCFKCTKNCRTKSTFCNSGRHWVHYNCQRLSTKEIELLEKEELEDYTCRICQDVNLKILEKVLSPVKKGANSKTSYHHNDVPAITQEISSSRNDDSTEKSPETCNICDTIIMEDKYEICDICNDIAHPECMTISGNSLTCHSCCNTIERLEPTQDENEQIDTSQTFIKSCELPENEENNPEQSQETATIRTNRPKRQELHNNHEIANNNQQYAQEKKTNQRNGKKTTQRTNLDPFPTHEQSTSERIEQDEVAIVKLREIRERELKLRKAEEHLKMKEKIFKEEQSKIVLLETRCQYLESKNCELESLVNTMKRRLDMNTSTNISNPQGMGHSTPLNEQMQGKINNRILAFHEKLTNLVMDQVENQLQKVAESLNITDERLDIHHENRVNNPSYESNQENGRAAMNIASTVSPSVPTNPEVIQNPLKVCNGVAQVNMNYPPRIESTSLKPGCNIMTSGYNVNEGHRGQVLGPDAINNNDTVRYNFPPPMYNAHQNTGQMTPIIITQMPFVHNTAPQERPTIPSLPQKLTSINRPQYIQPNNRKHVTVQDRRRNEQSRNNSARTDVSDIEPTKPPMADQVAQSTEASNTTLQIVSFNCKSIKSCSATVRDLIRQNDFVLIQEHWLFEGQLNLIGEIDANVNYAAKGVDKYDPLPPIYLPRGYGGVAIIWKMNLDSIIKTLDDGRERIQCVEVLGKDNNNLILISIYLPSTGSRDHYEEFKDTIDQLNEIVLKYQDTHYIIIGGDLNEDLGNIDRINKRKDYLEKFVKETGLKYDNEGKTFVKVNGEECSELDYFLHKLGKIKPTHKQVLNSVMNNTSDHHPIKMKILYGISNDADCKNLTKDCTNRAVKWDKVDEMRKYYAQWVKQGKIKDPENNIYQQRLRTKKEFRRQVRIENAKVKDTEKQRIMETRTKDTKLFHQLVKINRKNRGNAIMDLHVGDICMSGEQNVMEGFKQHFRNLATPEESTVLENRQYHQQVEYEIGLITEMVKDKNIPPATLEELQKAIKSINKGKSADIYGITVEHILHAGKNLEMLLLNLINIIFKEGKVPDMLKEGLLTPVFKNKGEKNMATNYRGITVLPVLNKVIETIVKLRINPAVLITQNVTQRGFTAGSGPANAALPVEEIYREAKDNNQEYELVLLDAKSAFDVVIHSHLMKRLYHAGIDDKHWTIIQTNTAKLLKFKCTVLQILA